jgi:hypothetical protein
MLRFTWRTRFVHEMENCAPSPSKRKMKLCVFAEVRENETVRLRREYEMLHNLLTYFRSAYSQDMWSESERNCGVRDRERWQLCVFTVYGNYAEHAKVALNFEYRSDFKTKMEIFYEIQ